MPNLTAADTIRILVSTDNHVGYNERDPIRGDDSWKSFHEVMCLAQERDVDMVLLAGDLFHENKPSRKSMYQVMRSLRLNCYGDKPCELQMLGDGTENFQGAFNHVNYEDPDINVAIPVFSIHGNHDDPSGEGHLAALDILQVSGLLNYYGRTPESDNIHVKPVLLQKGRTKLALYGLSNVRDERLFRTFRDSKVKFYQPSAQKEDWFNLIAVHQNHHAYTETGYLPENFLPEFMNLVIWGHEHECLIDPKFNLEMNFKVMQPGSSVATSLVPGEAVSKHVAILSISGREFETENIRLKTVRPFIMEEIVLHDDKEASRLARKDNNRTQITRILEKKVSDMIDRANNEWLEIHDTNGEDENDESQIPLPLIRLRVEISTPDGGNYDCENPQRFSNRFIGRVANVNDVVQYHRRKQNASSMRKAADGVSDEVVMSSLQGLDSIKVEKLVREFLEAQSLTILPQNSFGDAVSQFIDKDDKHAMEMFVNESLATQIKHLLTLDRSSRDQEDDDAEENQLMEAIEKYRTQLEDLFAKGHLKRVRGGKKRVKPRPKEWDSEWEGTWEEQPGALLRSDNEEANSEEDQDESDETPRPAARSNRGKETGTGRGRGRGRGRGGRGAGATSSTRNSATSSKKATTNGRGRKKATHEDEEEEEEEEDDVVMVDVDSDESDSQAIFVRDTAPKRGRGRGRASRASPVKRVSARAAAPRATQSKLNFTASQASVVGRQRNGSQAGVSDDIEDDDEEDFEPVPAKSRRR
ncbi:MAG: hypothetical protein Q9160_000554 [Pyrenula sp. 1 TL-2023]